MCRYTINSVYRMTCIRVETADGRLIVVVIKCEFLIATYTREELGYPYFNGHENVLIGILSIISHAQFVIASLKSCICTFFIYMKNV